jgi:hypothetical protein
MTTSFGTSPALERTVQDAGPDPHAVLSAFLMWLSRQSSADSIDILLLFGSAGRSLQKATTTDTKRHFPLSAYLVMPPPAIMLANIHFLNIAEELPPLAATAEGHSVSEFFGYLGIPLPAQNFMRDIYLPDETVIRASTREVFIRFLYAYRWEILKVCRHRRQELFREFLQAGIMDGMRVGIADLGWDPNSQAALSGALDAMFEVQTYAYCFCLRDDAESIALRGATRTHAMISADKSSDLAVEKLYSMRSKIEMLFGPWPEDAADSVPDIQPLLQQPH